MHLTLPLHKGAQERPHHTALVHADRRRSWAELAARVARLAAGLVARGCRPDDRVGVLGPNSDHYVEALFAIWWAGGVATPINTRGSAGEIAYSLADSGTAILLADASFLDMAMGLSTGGGLVALGADVGDITGTDSLIAGHGAVPDAGHGGDALAAILYTGGTTGRPKGVMLSHGNLYTNALVTLAATPRPALSVGLQVAPLFHAGGIGPMLQYALGLATQVILPGFTPESVLAAVAGERVTELFLVPTMLKRLIEHPSFAAHDLSSLRLLLYGAAPIDATLLERAMAVLPAAAFAQCYGMTELSPVISILADHWHRADGLAAGKLASAGRPVAGCAVRIADADGQTLPPGRVGEILARGPTVMQGYWGKPAETAAALRDGWMHTGDAGYLDEDGFLFVVDRLKDMIVTGGENVYSAEVEDVLLRMPAVSACAIIGIPDPVWGERVHAIIVPRPGHAVPTLESVALHCRDRLAGYKCPRSLEIRDSLPLSAAGKLLKHELRAPHWQGRPRQV